MSWGYFKYRIRKRAEGAVFAISACLNGEDDGNPEENLEEHLRRRAKIRDFEEGVL